jgi:hypothetical protein
LGGAIERTLEAVSMSKIGNGYGSEWHLQRFLGVHRNWFDKKVCASTGAETVEWLDFPFRRKKKPSEHGDRELAGVEFLTADSRAREAWLSFWPARGKPPTWDVVGKLRFDGHTEWLLVEAKAHVHELRSQGKAVESGGLAKIRRAFRQVQHATGTEENPELWLKPYYQHCNRLAVLHFLSGHGEPARLLMVYFCGDTYLGKRCPKSASEWHPHIEKMNKTLGLSGESALEKNIYHLFVSVAGEQ